MLPQKFVHSSNQIVYNIFIASCEIASEAEGIIRFRRNNLTFMQNNRDIIMKQSHKG